MSRTNDMCIALFVLTVSVVVASAIPGRSTPPAPTRLTTASATLASLPITSQPADSLPTSRYLAGDTHTHTWISPDGRHTEHEIASAAFSVYGLDWISATDHGGVSLHTDTGAPISTWMWRTLTNYAYPAVLAQRELFPGKWIIQGVEWNVPGHEHAGVGIATDQPAAISQFDYRFDSTDKSTSNPSWSKRNKTHADAITATRWLGSHFPTTSYVIINHPSRYLSYSVRDLRDLNNAAPKVAFGFEGLPGRQKSPSRGGYSSYFGSSTRFARTYGGADYFLARVGGVWDSLLGEGRKYFSVADSDFHDPSSDFWPGEYAKTYTWVDTTKGLGGVVAGMRSGNSFTVSGGIIDQLTFRAGAAKKSATMGQTLSVYHGRDVTVTVTFRVPATRNHPDPPQVDHIDLIRGHTHGKYKPGSSQYYSRINSTTKVIRRTRPSTPWIGTGSEGSTYRVTYTIHNVHHSSYIRLRGTNLGLSVPGQTDAAGNPLLDTKNTNTPEKAWADCWFYSNPIFIKVVD